MSMFDHDHFPWFSWWSTWKVLSGCPGPAKERQDALEKRSRSGVQQQSWSRWGSCWWICGYWWSPTGRCERLGGQGKNMWRPESNHISLHVFFFFAFTLKPCDFKILISSIDFIWFVDVYAFFFQSRCRQDDTEELQNQLVEFEEAPADAFDESQSHAIAAARLARQKAGQHGKTHSGSWWCIFSVTMCVAVSNPTSSVSNPTSNSWRSKRIALRCFCQKCFVYVQVYMKVSNFNSFGSFACTIYEFQTNLSNFK